MGRISDETHLLRISFYLLQQRNEETVERWGGKKRFPAVHATVEDLHFTAVANSN